MGLTLGVKECLNCGCKLSNNHINGREVVIESKRGDFYIPIDCWNCGAEMAMVVWEEIQHNSLPTYNIHSVAIAFRHTINDETCYDEDCERCYGEKE